MKLSSLFVLFFSGIESSKCFKIHKNDDKTWAGAVLACAQKYQGGTLAVVNNWNEVHDFLRRFDIDDISSGYDVWVGMYRLSTYGGTTNQRLRNFFDVEDDRSVSEKFQNAYDSRFWKNLMFWDGEPNNSDGREYCIHMHLRGPNMKFNDQVCHETYSYACQYDC